MARPRKDPLKRLVASKVKPEQYWTFYWLARHEPNLERRAAYSLLIKHMVPPPRDLNSEAALGDWGEEAFLLTHPEMLTARDKWQADHPYDCAPEFHDAPPPAAEDIPKYAVQQHIIFPPTETDIETIGELISANTNSDRTQPWDPYAAKPIAPGASAGPPIVRPPTQIRPSTDIGGGGFGSDGP